MKLTIDTLDYSRAVAPEPPLRLTRRLNEPEDLRVALIADSPDFLVPETRARVVLSRDDQHKLFTGYLRALEHEYLGWGERGPMYRYLLLAESDECLLDQRPQPARAPFVLRTAGEILAQLTADALPGAFDTTLLQSLVTLPRFASDAQRTWSSHARSLARLGRGVYRAHDGRISLAPVAERTHLLDESAAGFEPAGLRLMPGPRVINDLTVVGRMEPRAYCKDYFLGDGLSLRFGLSHAPFTHSPSAYVEDEFRGSALDPARWSATDPAAKVSVSNGKLRVAGGTGADGATTVRFVEKLELAGAHLLQHGEVSFTAASDGVLGGLYNGAIALANCVAGFRVTPSGGQSTLQPLINGALAGTPLTTIAGHTYVLTTRLYASEIFRREQSFHSSAHPAGSPRGGGTRSADVRLVLEVHNLDPANPGSRAAASTVLYDGVLSAAPESCAYALLNSRTLFCDIAFTRLLRAGDAEVRTTIPGQPARTRLVGTVPEGGECLLDDYELAFHSAYVPATGEQIVARYRSRGRAIARYFDAASAAALARNGDDGTRVAVRRVATPAARTQRECEHAALALLDDFVAPAWAGDCAIWAMALADADPLPGDGVHVLAPARGADFTAILREVSLDCSPFADAAARYHLSFANDAHTSLGFDLDPANLSDLYELDRVAVGTEPPVISDLPAAEVTGITSIAVSLDAGVAPPAGGGIEVRLNDYGWGLESERNLLGRFSARTFSVPRLTRAVTFYLRQYDSAGRYSRYSTALHVDYPL